MSARQDARAERRYELWAPRFTAAKGQERAEVAWQYLKARINDKPKREQAKAWEDLAGELIRLAERVTQSDIRTVKFTPPANLSRPHAPRRGAQAREAQLNRTSPRKAST